MDDLTAEIRQLLTAAGLHAVKAFPSFRLPRLLDPMIAVGQSTIRLLPCAFSDYIGLCAQAAASGFEAEIVIQLDVYSPYRKGGSVCADAVRSALSAVADGLDSCTAKDIRVDPVYYDENTDCFRSKICLTFGMLLYQSES